MNRTQNQIRTIAVFVAAFALAIPLNAQDGNSENAKGTKEGTVATQEKKPKPKMVANQTKQSVDVANQDGTKSKLHFWLFLPPQYKPAPSVTKKLAGNQETNDDKSKAQDAKPKSKSEPAVAEKKWPLLIFLHGMGERGNDLDRVKMWGPPKIVQQKPDFPFVLISPQCPNSVRRWNAEHLNQLIDQVAKTHNIDSKRIYLTGLSMGGYGTWELAAKYPKKFAAAAPVCGGGDASVCKNLVDLPVWAFHGDNDKVVPLAASQKMVDGIKAAGGKRAKLTVYPGVGHNSWSETYANPKLYEWFLSHKKD